MRMLAQLKKSVQVWRETESQVKHLLELIELAITENDPSITSSLSEETSEIQATLDSLELELAFSGEYDQRNAILAIHAGAGGTEAQDWAQMLERMYLRWAERRGFEAEIIETSPGEEAGVKSVTIEITGANAYGYLKSERGTHRLVRLSPFDSQHLRHTSFALVEVLPVVQQNVDIALNPDELKIDTYHASGHGGQNVQKVSSAVRITHLPTGIVVTCQSERSQLQNKESAMKVLLGRLTELEVQKKADEKAKLKGAHKPAEFGNQIRSYVLHPYKLVKDHRTAQESTNAEAVLDGDLDSFLRAYLKDQINA